MMFAGPDFRLEILPECASTNELLLARRERPDFPGTALLALRQTAGQGRRGRAWRSPAGNLALSLAFRLHDHRPLGLLSFFLGLAARRALLPLLPGQRIRLKWPNDIYLNDKKLAGILAQARQLGAATDVVVGIGLNLASAPEGVDIPAAAVAEYTAPPRPEDFARALLAEWKRLQAEVSSFAELRALWEAAAGFPGLELDIVGEPGVWRAVRLLPTGELEVSGEDGVPRRLASETVSVRIHQG